MKLNTATDTLCAGGSNNPKATRKPATWAPSRVRKAKQPPICEESLAVFTQNCRRETLCHAPAIMPSKGQNHKHIKNPNQMKGVTETTLQLKCLHHAGSSLQMRISWIQSMSPGVHCEGRTRLDTLVQVASPAGSSFKALPTYLVATSKTKQHIRAGPASSASSTVAVDPWLNGADPWGQYQSVSTAPLPSQHVQKKFDDVEQRLQESVVAQVTESVQQAAAQFTSNDRIALVENQMQALMQSQSNLEAWMQDGQQKMQEFRQDQDKIQHVVGQCASTIQAQGATLGQVVQDAAACSNALKDPGLSLSQVVKEVGGLKDALASQLASYFEKQSSKLEALLEKKQRTSWLGRRGLFHGLGRVPQCSKT